MDRTPFVATSMGRSYDGMEHLPAVFVLEDIRSLYNVGAILRTADAVRLQEVGVVGITADPHDRRLAKTALGAEQRVRWRRASSAVDVILDLRERGFEITVLETLEPAVDLFEWVPRFPVCVVFGHEIDGIGQTTVHLADTRLRIPMLGVKHSLNVATAAGVVAYELLRQYRSRYLSAPQRVG